jgi:hypothetical protein
MLYFLFWYVGNYYVSKECHCVLHVAFRCYTTLPCMVRSLTFSNQ